MQALKEHPRRAEIDSALAWIEKIYSRLQLEETPLPTDYQVVPLNDYEWLIRFQEDQQLSWLLLQVFPLERKTSGFRFVDVKGELFKANREWMRFILRLALPREAQEASQVSLDEDHVASLHGLLVSTDGAITHFSDKNPQWERYLKECSSCSEKIPLGYLERKVGEKRCWKCTGIAGSVGLLVSTLAAWVSEPMMNLLGVEGAEPLRRIAYTVFGMGTAYTIWRVSFWGYLPYQNWIAYWLESRKREEKTSDQHPKGGNHDE